MLLRYEIEPLTGSLTQARFFFCHDVSAKVAFAHSNVRRRRWWFALERGETGKRRTRGKTRRADRGHARRIWTKIAMLAVFTRGIGPNSGHE